MQTLAVGGTAARGDRPRDVARPGKQLDRAVGCAAPSTRCVTGRVHRSRRGRRNFLPPIERGHELLVSPRAASSWSSVRLVNVVPVDSRRRGKRLAFGCRQREVTMCAWVRIVRRTGGPRTVDGGRTNGDSHCRTHHEGVDQVMPSFVDDHAALADPPRSSPPGRKPGEPRRAELGERVPGVRPCASRLRLGVPASIPGRHGPRSTLARMSERFPGTCPRRTWPGPCPVRGRKKKMPRQAPGLGADMVFLDLERLRRAARRREARARDNVVTRHPPTRLRATTVVLCKG